MKLLLTGSFHVRVSSGLALGFLSATAFVAPLPARAAPSGDCRVGEVLFKDTLYGLGGGLVIGGLVLIAQGNSKNIPANVATGGLIGAGVGAAVGVAELSLSDCRGRLGANDSQGFRVPKPIYREFASLDEESQKDRGLGVKFEYGFPTKR